MSGISSKKFILILICLLSAQSDWAQQKEELKASFTMSSLDGRYSCSINSVINQDGEFAGYFTIPMYNGIILGKSGHGYDFMNYETSGVDVDFLVPKWIQNNFQLGDLEGFSQGPDVKTTVSFNLKPIYSDDKKSNKKAFIVKFAVLTPKRKTQYSAFDQNCDVKLFYKLLYPDSIGSLRVEYLTKVMPEYQFELKITNVNREENTIETNAMVFNEIKKSLRESTITNKNFELSAEIGIYPPEELGLWVRGYGLLENHEQNCLTHKYYLVTDFSLDTLKLEQPIYCANLKFPFKIYNDEKTAKYKNYKAKEEIFISNYQIIVIPISYENGLLVADVISNYSKLNLDDGMQRWTPFKKRIEFKFKEAFIDMPKENWSAVFSRGNENYEIYGYSDYEKYVKEMLSIKLQKVF